MREHQLHEEERGEARQEVRKKKHCRAKRMEQGGRSVRAAAWMETLARAGAAVSSETQEARKAEEIVQAIARRLKSGSADEHSIIPLTTVQSTGYRMLDPADREKVRMLNTAVVTIVFPAQKAYQDVCVLSWKTRSHLAWRLLEEIEILKNRKRGKRKSVFADCVGGPNKIERLLLRFQGWAAATNVADPLRWEVDHVFRSSPHRIARRPVPAQ